VRELLRSAAGEERQLSMWHVEGRTFSRDWLNLNNESVSFVTALR
jgi:hypothetical protein